MSWTEACRTRPALAFLAPGRRGGGVVDGVVAAAVVVVVVVRTRRGLNLAGTKGVPAWLAAGEGGAGKEDNKRSLTEACRTRLAPVLFLRGSCGTRRGGDVDSVDAGADVVVVLRSMGLTVAGMLVLVTGLPSAEAPRASDAAPASHAARVSTGVDRRSFPAVTSSTTP
jgi:hypothetical protein